MGLSALKRVIQKAVCLFGDYFLLGYVSDAKHGNNCNCRNSDESIVTGNGRIYGSGVNNDRLYCGELAAVKIHIGSSRRGVCLVNEILRHGVGSGDSLIRSEKAVLIRFYPALSIGGSQISDRPVLLISLAKDASPASSS